MYEKRSHFKESISVDGLSLQGKLCLQLERKSLFPELEKLGFSQTVLQFYGRILKGNFMTDQRASDG